MQTTVEQQSAIRSLAEFPYLGNYLRLSLIEWDLLELKGGENVLFIGSGPFPLTAIVLNLISRAAAIGRLEQFRAICSASEVDKDAFCEEMSCLIMKGAPCSEHLKVELLDRSAEATEYASQLITILNLSDDMKAICGDGNSANPDQECSIIYIASMVKEKNAVIKHLIGQASHPLKILIRGVEPGSLKELLYEPLSPIEISNIAAEFPGFSELKTYWPDNRSGVINSVHIFGYSLMQ